MLSTPGRTFSRLSASNMLKNEGYRFTPYIMIKYERRSKILQTVVPIINETKHHLNFKHQRFI